MKPIHRGPEAGRKRLAKLLGLAPFRVELDFQGQKLSIFIDGVPATAEQIQVFEQDVRAVNGNHIFRMN